MDYGRIAKLHNKVFSTPRNSPEREKAMSALSEADRAAVVDYDVGVKSGRIKEININEQEENKTMTYETYKAKMNGNERGAMMEVSQFAMQSPEIYQQYRERYQQEKDEENRKHNYKLAGWQ